MENFNPRGPCGPRLSSGPSAACNRHFNPRGPCGPRRCGRGSGDCQGRHFNPRGPCGPRLVGLLTRDLDEGISILAVLADRDARLLQNAGSRQEFQSSRSLRTATKPGRRCTSFSWNFNPRGPCGPRPLGISTDSVRSYEFQSSRSLRTATTAKPAPLSRGIFQSSRSLRTATLPVACLAGLDGISILAVLADRDCTGSPRPAARPYFNPRGPCGPRPFHDNYLQYTDYISILAVLADRD